MSNVIVPADESSPPYNIGKPQTFDVEPSVAKQTEETSNRFNLTKWRNYLAFWIFGLCNNFGYVIMLSAAHDILNPAEDTPMNTTNETTTDQRDCNPTSVGAVLLADTIPTMLVKLTAPFFMQRIPYSLRVAAVVVAQAASFVIVAFSDALWLALVGVAVGSLATGLGELTFLAFTAHFNPTAVSFWSSGTGAAGVLPSFLYAALTQWGVSPKATLLLMLVVPVVWAAGYWLVLKMPDTIQSVHDRIAALRGGAEEVNRPDKIKLSEKFRLMLPLLKYMLPLFFVYFAEYYINQGLIELIFYRGIFLDHDEQYRWFQVLYQLGVLLSRSSVNLVNISTRFFPIIAMLQVINAILFTFEALYFFVPSIWIIFPLMLYEGLLGGAIYVNAFFNIRKEVDPGRVEFSLGAASMADAMGIVISGFVSMAVHNAICTLPVP